MEDRQRDRIFRMVNKINDTLDSLSNAEYVALPQEIRKSLHAVFQANDHLENLLFDDEQENR